LERKGKENIRGLGREVQGLRSILAEGSARMGPELWVVGC
jgi:hypothetical protein